jgi:hypothetical protein
MPLKTNAYFELKLMAHLTPSAALDMIPPV